MADRISGRERIESQIVAEREVMRFKDDHSLWHKHIHNVTLDPMQVLKCLDMDKHDNTIDYSCRRTGKTAIKELYFLKYNATKADQELGIVAPREAQALVNLGYHLDAIRRSPVLQAWINFKSQRVQMADTYYQFANRSIARGYGIMAQVDGGDLTCASLEEVDDMPRDRLFSRFLLMMGSTRRLGADEGAENRPQIRITGVFKGADTLSGMVESGGYHVLPTVDVHLGIQLGILQAAFMQKMRDELSPDEYIRQLLCRNISARNCIWESYIREALTVGLRAGLEWVEPLPGTEYVKRGELSFGYDASGHGESPEASRHALVVTEQLGNYVVFRFCRTWPAGADDMTVKRDLIAYWRYFRPDHAIGDAYGVGMLTSLNDDLYKQGLTTIDRNAVGDGASTASTWPEWAFSPLRFEGMTKHQMAQALRAVFHQRHAAIPFFDDAQDVPPALRDLQLLVRQLGNVAVKANKAAYPSYKMASTKIGDDLFDAAMAAVWALATRGLADVAPVVLTSTRTRADLLTGNRAAA